MIVTKQIDPTHISWQGTVGIFEASSAGVNELVLALTVTSPKTGVTKTFKYNQTFHTKDHELMYTVYWSECGQYSLRMLND